jgi:hypothetical protein
MRLRGHQTQVVVVVVVVMAVVTAGTVERES